MRKCVFVDISGTYLRHVRQIRRLEVEQSNVLSVEPAKPPLKQMELRSFFESCIIYCTFFKGFAKLVASLNQMTRKKKPFEFKLLSDEELEALEELKKHLVWPPILVLRCYGRNYTFYMDTREAPGRLLQERSISLPWTSRVP